jgi:hypothetical protein
VVQLCQMAAAMASRRWATRVNMRRPEFSGQLSCG